MSSDKFGAYQVGLNEACSVHLKQQIAVNEKLNKMNEKTNNDKLDKLQKLSNKPIELFPKESYVVADDNFRFVIHKFDNGKYGILDSNKNEYLGDGKSAFSWKKSSSSFIKYCLFDSFESAVDRLRKNLEKLIADRKNLHTGRNLYITNDYTFIDVKKLAELQRNNDEYKKLLTKKEKDDRKKKRKRKRVSIKEAVEWFFHGKSIDRYADEDDYLNLPE